MRSCRTKTLPLIGIATLFGCALRAETIGPDCETCYGATYDLSGWLLTSDETTETWRVRYEVGTSGYNRGGVSPILTDYISSVAIKVSTGLVTIVDFSGPQGWLPPAEKNSGLNNSGCSGSGNGWVCAQTNATSTVTDGSTYQWLFDVQIASGSFLDTASIKTNYGPRNGILVSENIRVPEPFDLPYLLGALGIALWLRRRSQRAQRVI